MRAAVRVVGPGTPPEPIRLSAAALVRGEGAGRVVRMEGVVAAAAARDGAFVLTLRDGAAHVDAVWPGGDPPARWADLPVGARLAVAGACYWPPNAGDATSAPTVALRDAADVEVLELPPPASWWTAGRVGFVVGGAAIAVGAAALWLALLRRQVRKQAAEIRAHFELVAGLESRLAQAQKLEAVGRLAGGIAHDFNNILTVITGNADLAAGLLTPGHPAGPFVDDIRTAGARATGLTRQLLTFSRQGPAELRPLDINAAVAESERLLRRLIGANVALTCDFAAGLPPVKADPAMIHQVVVNLAVNARDAMPAGGTLRVRTAAYGSGVRLSVADSGVGMDERVQARLFEPFFTTKPVGQGVGLGLATVYGIVGKLGGEIRVRSAVGRGTTFEIDLPASSSLVADTPPAAAPPRPGGAGRVLLVEDEDGVRAACAGRWRCTGTSCWRRRRRRRAWPWRGTPPGPSTCW